MQERFRNNRVGFLDLFQQHPQAVYDGGLFPERQLQVFGLCKQGAKVFQPIDEQADVGFASGDLGQQRCPKQNAVAPAFGLQAGFLPQSFRRQNGRDDRDVGRGCRPGIQDQQFQQVLIQGRVAGYAK